MQAAKNWCDEERVKKLGIWDASKQGPDHLIRPAAAPVLDKNKIAEECRACPCLLVRQRLRRRRPPWHVQPCKDSGKPFSFCSQERRTGGTPSTTAFLFMMSWNGISYDNYPNLNCKWKIYTIISMFFILKNSTMKKDRSHDISER